MQLVAKLGNPTYVAKSNRNFLYTVDQKQTDGGLAAIDLNHEPAGCATCGYPGNSLHTCRLMRNVNLYTVPLPFGYYNRLQDQADGTAAN